MSFRLTPQRLAIIESLKGNRDHPSAEDVFREVKKNFSTISLATVYNTLELLRRRGVIAELPVDRKRRRYDPDTGEHHHLVCRSCGKITDIESAIPVKPPAGEDGGFLVLNSQVNFYGFCGACRGKEVKEMAVFKCSKCKATKEGRCKPKKCPSCGAEGTMEKQQ